MGQFTTTGNHSIALKEIELPVTESKRLHLVGVKARVASDIKLVFDKKIEASIKVTPFDGPKGIWVVDVKGISKSTETWPGKHFIR
ncbi:hypothetical protein FKG94_11840 [Exilibacterium tricleocarpae]|uniref:Uncharacterized protein n=1 Tax=Exilibacterium tricleocarpae TaxID=2591008 RepID=A0A545TNB3_9GAMM|nr:hypothetical protein [Exilibacterium tricleocarpae]TQV78713.1 hypothetical protein FKG94_11840 [Exilibacterium tricleocarpae]